MRITSLGLLSVCFMVACGGERRPAESPEYEYTEGDQTNTGTIETESSPLMPASGDYYETDTQTATGVEGTTTGHSPSSPAVRDDQSPMTGAADEPGMDSRTADPGERSADSDAVAQPQGESGLTPPDQLENSSDLEITQRIRKALMSNESLSFAAKNAKIITRNGQVTLNGAVESEQERAAIAAAATSVVGANNVNNQLQVNK